MQITKFHIEKVSRATLKDAAFSILIPSWNNLAYLQLCIRSIKEHSTYPHQIIVIVNEGVDGTIEWVKSQKDLDYIYSKENLGICYGLNFARELVKTDYILYANDDMYLLPNWDAELAKEINLIDHDDFMLSSTMIEPFITKNTCTIHGDFGQNVEDFEEVRLLKECDSLQKNDWQGSTWPPNVVPTKLWDKVGGMSVEFSPGMYSDPDFSMKLWQAGVRYFKGIGKSKVYHFGSKSTGRIVKNDGRKTFIKKWGITPKTFAEKFLQRGAIFETVLPDYELNLSEKVLNQCKKVVYSLF